MIAVALVARGRGRCRSRRAAPSARCCAPPSVPRSTSSAEVSPLAEYRALFADDARDEVLFTVASDGRAARARAPGDPRLLRRRGLSAAAAPARSTPAASCACRRCSTPGDGHAGRGAGHDRGSATASGCRPPAGSRRCSSRGPERRRSPIGSTTTRPRRPACRRRAAVSTPATRIVVRCRRARGGRPRGDRGARRRERRVAAPESLRTGWTSTSSGSGGAALAGLVALLRERGYLSHAPVRSTTAARGLDCGRCRTTRSSRARRGIRSPGSTRCSAASSSARRTRGRRRPATTSPRSATTSSSRSRSRSSRASSAFPPASWSVRASSAPNRALARCENGVCRAQDLAAWTEVQSSRGDWVPIDVTPQYAQSPSLDVTEQRDPENVTEVRPDSVEEVLAARSGAGGLGVRRHRR